MLEAGADGARSGKGEGVFGRVSIIAVFTVVQEAVEMLIEIVVKCLCHRLHRGHVIRRKNSEIVRRLILERVHVLGNVDFHVYCRATVGWIAQFPPCDYGTVRRLGVMLRGCLEEQFVGVCSLGFVYFKYSTLYRQGGRDVVVRPSSSFPVAASVTTNFPLT